MAAANRCRQASGVVRTRKLTAVEIYSASTTQRNLTAPERSLPGASTSGNLEADNGSTLAARGCNCRGQSARQTSGNLAVSNFIEVPESELPVAVEVKGLVRLIHVLGQ
jgi:hypothetical protein